MIASIPLPFLCTLMLLLSLALVLMACTTSDDSEPTEFLAAEVKPLSAELVRVEVKTDGGNARRAAPAYAECSAAQYTLIRGLGYLRRVSSAQGRRGKAWLQTNLYSLSLNEPRGASVIEAKQAVDACKAAKIPTF